MDDGLRVEQDRYFVGRGAEQPVGFDDLEPFVDQRGRIYGNLGAHLPLGVPQGLPDGDGFELFVREVAQGAAATRNDKPPHGRLLARKTLEDGRVFRINGQNRRPVLLGQAHDDFAADDQRFLVGQGEFLAGAQGCDGGREPGIADQRIDHNVRVAPRRPPAPRPLLRRRPWCRYRSKPCGGVRSMCCRQ